MGRSALISGEGDLTAGNACSTTVTLLSRFVAIRRAYLFDHRELAVRVPRQLLDGSVQQCADVRALDAVQRTREVLVNSFLW